MWIYLGKIETIKNELQRRAARAGLVATSGLVVWRDE